MTSNYNFDVRTGTSRLSRVLNNLSLPVEEMEASSMETGAPGGLAEPIERKLSTSTMIGKQDSRSRILFMSSCPEAWGGSEELWAGAARRLARDGNEVSVVKTFVDTNHPRIRELIEQGIGVQDYYRCGIPRLARYVHSLLPSQLRFLPIGEEERVFGLTRRIRALSPDLAVISQGENFDGLQFCNACQETGVPYVLICQKASDLNWPHDCIRTTMQRAFSEAEHVFFVSEHNRGLTERQIACRLLHSEVVRNPYQTQVDEPLPYPDFSSGRLRLACVARLFVLEKGQDTLLDVLALPKWRSRNLEVNFYGSGMHREALDRVRGMLELDNVCFRGFTNDITEVWRQHHALILPSRAEGLPLALVEAMLCGRAGIVTNVGGNAEVIRDGESGFIARGMDAASLDDVMEQAWARRGELEQIGLEAARRIRGLVSSDPCGDFARKLAVHTAQLKTRKCGALLGKTQRRHGGAKIG